MKSDQKTFNLTSYFEDGGHDVIS